MAKKKMPPQLLEYFKNKNEKKEDGSEMSDNCLLYTSPSPRDLG